MLAPAPGALIAGTYQLIAIIGEGASGVVYRAEATTGTAPVAIKLIRLEHALREQMRARFLREARLASTMQHPNAVRVHDYGADDDVLYLVMELLEGEDLRHRLDRALAGDASAMTGPEIARTGAQIAAALRDAHEVGLVHRDIKPQNIFLERRPAGAWVRVLDFGLAFLINNEGSLGRLTDEGVVTGTPHYMSPEQAAGERLGPASDVYSLGCVLYELITGQPPFMGSLVEIMTRHMVVPPTAPAALVGSRTAADAPGLEALVMAMLVKAADKRPTTAEVLDALVELGQSAFAAAGAAARTDTEAHAGADVAPDRAPAPAGGGEGQVPVAILGPCDEQVLLALRVNGVEPVPVALDQAEPDPAAGTVLAGFVPGADVAGLARARALLPADVPVLTSVPPADLVRLAEFVRAGFADVVVEPLHGQDLARKLMRALRRARGQRGLPER
ncbi:serine/threonine-protein kinase [Haliangium sp.]|uniref:serine/threonine-protein kinase n=1 Tax=Haliangium sp. TaxID=2663208 RepID=UPI003D0FF8BB